MSDIDLGMNLYEFNKQAMNSERPLDPIALNIKTIEIAKEMEKKKYWMLLCNERKDYSVFVVKKKTNIAEELKITITNRGHILSIDKQEDGSYEIWIRDFDTKENFAYYLFDYTFGIIKV